MRLLLTLFIVIIVIGAAYAYRSELDIDNNLARGISKIRQQFGNEADTTTTRIYKYRNAKGEWVFTNTPPKSSSANAEDESVLEYRSDTNVLPTPQKDKNKTDQPSTQRK